MKQMTTTSGITISAIGYAEKPLRSDPAHSTEHYLFTAVERAAIMEEALTSGIDFFLAAHERDAAVLAESFARLGCRDHVVLAATDGDILSRCADTEADGMRAVETALARKLHLLQTDYLDFFLLYDFRSERHTPARCAGARRALEQARDAGAIRAYGATCYQDYAALTHAIEADLISPELVIARMNAVDSQASNRLIPACAAWQIAFYAAQPFAWIGGVPFPRFPNAWRLRNMTKNFFGQTVGQAHLRWLLARPGVSGVMISMNEAGQPLESAQVYKGETLLPPPNAVESLFASLREAILDTDEGWRGLLQDSQWEIRQAAAEYLDTPR